MTKKVSLVFVVLLLGGCQLLTSEQVSCPKSAIVAEFSKTINLEENTLVRTEMDSLRPHCTREDTHIDMQLRLRLTSFRSLQNYDLPITLKPTYYVAMLDKQGKVISQTHHTVTIKFQEKQTTAVNFETIREKVPLNKEVSLYVGFNLTPSQLEFLEKERQRGQSSK